MAITAETKISEEIWSIQIVEDRINELLTSPNPTLQEICRHLHKAGGKRIRAQIMLLIGQILELPQNIITEYAAIIELIHLATLMHDDVIDEAKLRRHQPSTNHIWGNRLSILAGDFMITTGFMSLNQLRNFNIQKILANATQAMIQAEVNQQLARTNLELTPEQYLEIIDGKTASLFQAIGEIANELSPTTTQTMPKALGSLGRAFQLIDDIIDYNSSTQTLGKETARDLAENKITLPITLAYQQANPSNKENLQKLLQQAHNLDQHQPADQLQLTKIHQQIIKIFTELNIEQQIRHRAQEYILETLTCLQQYPTTKAKTQLITICNQLIIRTN